MQLDDFMNMLPMMLHEVAEFFEPRRGQRRNHFQASSSKDQIQQNVRFIPQTTTAPIGTTSG